jgi:hypothetical protein
MVSRAYNLLRVCVNTSYLCQAKSRSISVPHNPPAPKSLLNSLVDENNNNIVKAGGEGNMKNKNKNKKTQQWIVWEVEEEAARGRRA